MREFISSVKTEFIKARHTPLPLIHVLVPFLGALVFLLYYIISPWSLEEKNLLYLEALGITFPILIGLICAMSAEAELKAGNFQVMLGSKKRLATFYGKYCFLLLLGALALLIAVVGYGVVNYFALANHTLTVLYYLKATLYFLSAGLFLYVLHLIMAFRFNKGVTVIIGIIEGLLSALLRTSLGDGCWWFIPCAWTTRWIGYDIKGIVDPATKLSYVFCLISSISAIIIFGIWCQKWEGKHTEE